MDVNELRLRIPVSEDYIVISSWIKNSQEMAYWAGPQLPFPFNNNELSRLLKQSTEQSYVLTDQQNNTLGFGQFRINGPDSVHLCRIIVASALRGFGFGKILCRLLIKVAIERTNASRVTLRVYRYNLRAVATYQSLGFSVLEHESDQLILTMQRILV